MVIIDAGRPIRHIHIWCDVSVWCWLLLISKLAPPTMPNQWCHVVSQVQMPMDVPWCKHRGSGFTAVKRVTTYKYMWQRYNNKIGLQMFTLHPTPPHFTPLQKRSKPLCGTSKAKMKSQVPAPQTLPAVQPTRDPSFFVVQARQEWSPRSPHPRHCLLCSQPKIQARQI